MRYHHTLKKMAKIKRLYVGKNVEQLGLSYPAGGNVKRYNQFGKQFGSFLKS